SIAWDEGGVWALCAPHLLYIPDADGDLVPDGPPLRMLDGFDAEHIGHNMVNGLKWGPDGWLYGRHGITATSHVGVPGAPDGARTALNCSIWRYHPTTKVFEVVSNGGTNPWGMDWDRNGQLFYTNTVIGHLWHAIPGGYYQRMFGAHLNPHAYELIQHTADHYHWNKGSEKWSDIRKGISDKTSDLGGGHAHMGCLIYEGGVWPDAYRGKLFTCNLHGRRINMEHLEREGVGYVAKHAPDFLMMEDPWFRGLDLLTGPDGQVWVNDWSDTGECHDNDGIHRTSGRIYRIVYEGEDAGEPDIERPAWLTKRASSEFERVDIETMLESGIEEQVAMGVRWLAEDFGQEEETVKQLLELAGENSPGLVRLELAAALQRLPLAHRFTLASALSQHAEDADDRQQPLMIWYGISGAVTRYPDAAITLAMTSKLPTVTRLIARRLAEEIEEHPTRVDDLLTRTFVDGRTEIQLPVLRGIQQALEGWSRAGKPNSWDLVLSLVNESPSNQLRDLVRDLSVLFGDGRARDELLAIAGDREADPGARRSALKHLLQQPDDELLDLLKKWAADKVIAPQAIQGLAVYEAKGVSDKVLNFWDRQTLYRPIAIDTLVSRISYASDLLDAVETGRVPARAVSPFQARQIRSLGDEVLNQRLSELWGDFNETPEEK
ncbi:MAG: PVC-type heme-binding CxxCH protein, partial [Verrucomicrobiota bacterium]